VSSTAACQSRSNAWFPLPDLTEQAERLAAFRGATFDGFVGE